jgi:hypothetical protein
MKQLIILLSLLLIPLLASSQDENTYYYGVNGEIVDQMDNALVYKTVKLSSSGKATVKTFRKTRDGWIDTRIEKIGKGKNGISLVRYKEGTLFPRTFRREMKQISPDSYAFRDFKGKRTLQKGNSLTRAPLHYHGTCIQYYKDGTVASESRYENNYLISNKNWNPDGSPYIDNIHYSAHKPPIHPYGEAFIQNFITQQMVEKAFPLNEVHDELLVGFVIRETGALDGVRILKGKVESVNNFFIEIFQALPGEWEPALLDGKPVRYFITMPIALINDVPSLQNLELTPGGQVFWNY